MSDTPEESVEQRLGRIEALLQDLDRLASPEAAAAARELVTLLLGLHGAALARMIELSGPDERRSELLAAWAADRLPAGVLLLHGLHPVDLPTRVRQALEAVRADLRTRGADVELLGVVEGVVRLRLAESGPGQTRVLRAILEQLLGEAAPDARAVEWEGSEEPQTGRLSLPLIGLPG
jgi:hypothetical protein